MNRSIKSPFIFSKSQFPRVPFAGEEPTALLAPIPCVSLTVTVIFLPPLSDVVLTLSPLTSVLISETPSISHDRMATVASGSNLVLYLF